MAALLTALRANGKLALALLACAVCFGLGVRWQRGADALDQQQTLARVAAARKREQDEQTKADAQTQARLAGLEQQNADLIKRTAHETGKPTYRCALPSGGVQLRSAAIAPPAAE